MVAIEMAFDWRADGGPLLDVYWVVAKFSRIMFRGVLERKVMVLIRLCGFTRRSAPLLFVYDISVNMFSCGSALVY